VSKGFLAVGFVSQIIGLIFIILALAHTNVQLSSSPFLSDFLGLFLHYNSVMIAVGITIDVLGILCSLFALIPRETK
jgi:hypothetical protein